MENEEVQQVNPDCQAPAGGCPNGKIWDREKCECIEDIGATNAPA